MRYRRITNNIKDKCCNSDKENLNYKCHTSEANKMCTARQHRQKQMWVNDMMLILLFYSVHINMQCTQ